MLFWRPKLPQPRFAQGLFAVLLIWFVVVSRVKPAVGLTGLGVVLIVMATLVEANRQLIWEGYKRAYKKQRGWRGRLSEPREIYNLINIYLLWPAIFALGV